MARVQIYLVSSPLPPPQTIICKYRPYLHPHQPTSQHDTGHGNRSRDLSNRESSLRLLSHRAQAITTISWHLVLLNNEPIYLLHWFILNQMNHQIVMSFSNTQLQDHFYHFRNTKWHFRLEELSRHILRTYCTYLRPFLTVD